MTDLPAPIIEAVRDRFDQADVRNYDEVPSNLVYPYATFGPVQVIPDDDGCVNGSETFLQIDFWSKALNRAELSAMAGAAREALRTDLVIDGHHVIDQEVSDIRYERDPARELTHAILTLRLDTEPAA